MQDDLEWEYEYDQNDLETFHVPLDLTTHVAPMSRRRAMPSTSPPAARLQILDIHSASPLISFQNNLYACHWAVPLGTDLLFHVPPTAQQQRPHRHPHPYTLLAPTPLRLVAAPARLLPKHTRAPLPPHPAPAQPSTETTRAKATQHAFLQRLASLKASRGAADSVPLGRGAAEIHEPTSDGSSSSSSSSEHDSTARAGARGGGGGRAGPRRRGPGRAFRAPGGLFRDYVPELGDLPGADIRGDGLGVIADVHAGVDGSERVELAGRGAGGGYAVGGRRRGRGRGRCSRVVGDGGLLDLMDVDGVVERGG